jgi:Cadherin-like/Cadherin domain
VIVQVSDGAWSTTQAISVSVDPLNEGAPVITSDGGGSTAAMAVAETSTAVTTVVARDVDQPVQALTYALAGGADQALFVIDGATGVLSFAAAPVYESPADAGADNVYDVTVQVSDGSLVDTQAIQVRVTPVNDSVPVIVSDGGGAGASISVAENTTAVTTVVASDADLPVQTLTYSISGGADAARFILDSGTGALKFASAPDYESPVDANADNVYDVIVQASDGSLSTTQAISVSVNPVNDGSPGITSNGGGATASIGLAEGSSAVTTVAATDPDLPAQMLSFAIVGGADAGHFSIDAVTGVLTFAGAPDFELPADAGAENTYDVTVQVSDGLSVDQQAIRVTVSNIDDSAPVLTANRLDISEGGSAAPSIAAADSDSPASALTFSVTGASGGRFELTSAPGVAVTTFNQADLDAGRLRFVSDGSEAAPAYQLSVSDGLITSAPSAASVNFTPVNDAPVITSDGGAATATLAVTENSRNVTSVTATDAESASVLRFAITSGADASCFVIDPVSGVLQFAADPNHEQPADANGDNRYEVTVSVSDGSLIAQQALTVDVGNLNEAPVFVSNALLLSKDGATLVLLGTDPESAASALSYQASNLVGGRFERIAAPGVAITNFGQAEVSAGAVRFVTDGSGATPGYALRLSDGVSSVISAAPDVTFVATLDPPVPATNPAVSTPLPPEVPTPPAVVAAAPVAAPPAPVAVAVAPSPVPTDPFGEAPAQDYEPTRAATLSAAIVSSGAATPSAALRDPSVTGVETLVRFALLSEGSDDADSAGLPTIDLASALRERLLGQELDQLRDAAESLQRQSKEAIAASAMLSAGLSVGYVLWLARGGVLVASLMSALPAWAMVDPLPVLAQLKRGDDEPDDGTGDADNADDPLEKLFSKAREVVARGAAAVPPAPRIGTAGSGPSAAAVATADISPAMTETTA